MLVAEVGGYRCYSSEDQLVGLELGSLGALEWSRSYSLKRPFWEQSDVDSMPDDQPSPYIAREADYQHTSASGDNAPV